MKNDKARQSSAADDVVRLESSADDGVARLESAAGDAVVRLESSEADGVACLEPASADAVFRLDCAPSVTKSRPGKPESEDLFEVREVAIDIEEPWSGKRQPIPYGWFVLIGIFLLLVIVWATGGARPEGLAKIEQGRKEAADLGKEREREARALVEAVERRITGYLAADSIEGRLPHVWDPGGVESQMRSWYEWNEFRTADFERLVTFQPVDIGQQTFWKALVTAVGGDGETRELAPIILKQSGPTSVLIDWGGSTCYQPMSWDKYVNERPEGEAMDFRVIYEHDLDGLYSHEFSDEEQWRCFRLGAWGSEEFAFGYVERNGELDRELYQLFLQNRARPPAVILRLLRPEGTRSSRGVIIQKIVSPHWLSPDEPPTREPSKEQEKSQK